MRGRDTKQASMLCLISPESVVPTDHPLRAVKRLVEVALKELSPVFDAMYAKTGRPSIPPELYTPSRSGTGTGTGAGTEQGVRKNAKRSSAAC